MSNNNPVNPANHQQELLPTAIDSLTPAQQALHNNFVTSLKSLRKDLVRTAYYLAQISDRKVYRLMGFHKIADYAEAAGGLSARQCRDFLAIGRSLPQFKEIEAALTEGRLSWGQARLICTNTSPTEQANWLDASRTMTVRQLAEAITPAASEAPESAPPGPRPVPTARPPRLRPSQDSAEAAPAAPPAIPADRNHVVSLKLTGEQYARWQHLAEQAQRVGSISEAVLAGLAG